MKEMGEAAEDYKTGRCPLTRKQMAYGGFQVEVEG
jgi:hypothetical protein